MISHWFDVQFLLYLMEFNFEMHVGYLLVNVNSGDYGLFPHAGTLVKGEADSSRVFRWMLYEMELLEAARLIVLLVHRIGQETLL